MSTDLSGADSSGRICSAHDSPTRFILRHAVSLGLVLKPLFVITVGAQVKINGQVYNALLLLVCLFMLISIYLDVYYLLDEEQLDRFFEPDARVVCDNLTAENLLVINAVVLIIAAYLVDSALRGTNKDRASNQQRRIFSFLLAVTGIEYFVGYVSCTD